jgi:radical SAM superfamily enzyme YgiQ (UPF0313 family)
MSKKVLFIIPPYFDVKDLIKSQITSALPTFTIPYGILSMISYIEQHATRQVSFSVLDLNLEVYKKTLADPETDIDAFMYGRIDQLLEKETFDIVGISALFNNAWGYLEQMSQIIKKKPNAPLCIVGGGLASNLYEEILAAFTHIDAACLGEGEIPLLDLIDSVDMRSLLDTHVSWITQKKLRSSEQLGHTYVSNLDDIPPLSYSHIDLPYYNGRSLDKRYNTKEAKREFSIHTSRGCPYSCVYCSNTALHGKKVRYMSINRVMEEIDLMIEKEGMNVLLIEDDHFLADTERAALVLYEIGKRNIRVEFPNGIAVRGMNEEVGRALKAAGVSAVNLAVESGSNYVLKKLIKKPHLDRHIKPAVDILKKNAILVHAFIVIGLPGEMDEHRQETLNMIKDVGFDWVYFFIAVPIAGSRLYDICKDNGYLVDEDFSNHIVSKGTIKAPGVDPVEIEKTMYLMNLQVNFIESHNVQIGAYSKAKPYFEQVVNKYPDHALAHYMLAKTLVDKADDETKHLHKKQFEEIVANNAQWHQFAEHFKLI